MCVHKCIFNLEKKNVFISEEIQALEMLCNATLTILKTPVLGLPSEVGFQENPAPGESLGSGRTLAATAPRSHKEAALQMSPRARRHTPWYNLPNPPSFPSEMPWNLYHTNPTTLWISSSSQLLLKKSPC